MGRIFRENFKKRLTNAEHSDIILKQSIDGDINRIVASVLELADRHV